MHNPESRISLTGNEANIHPRLKRVGYLKYHNKKCEWQPHRVGTWVAIRIFYYLFSLNVPIGTAYEGNAFNLTPHLLLDVHLFLLELYNSRSNEYEQLIF